MRLPGASPKPSSNNEHESSQSEKPISFDSSKDGPVADKTMSDMLKVSEDARFREIASNSCSRIKSKYQCQLERHAQDLHVPQPLLSQPPHRALSLTISLAPLARRKRRHRLLLLWSCRLQSSLLQHQAQVCQVLLLSLLKLLMGKKRKNSRSLILMILTLINCSSARIEVGPFILTHPPLHLSSI